jgi:hypothetical protein
MSTFDTIVVSIDAKLKTLAAYISDLGCKGLVSGRKSRSIVACSVRSKKTGFRWSVYTLGTCSSYGERCTLSMTGVAHHVPHSTQVSATLRSIFSADLTRLT